MIGMKGRKLALLVVVLTMTQGALSQDEFTRNEDEEFRVESLAALPAKVMDAARAAAPDVAFQEASSLWLDDVRLYQVQGRLFREVWVVHVNENGRVLRVEKNLQDDD
ncbi:MAG: hypothetical protein ACI87W_000961 [Halieaceae bacterium]|jgi:hypothetical protein